ncbi:hypothetical protein GUJ93_ZPchr0006g42825 [Zizania palustris]|uniref:Uncharacterized protein n=1 Tax=Zizania palustris TaxID=103762 RepID=A0A8J5W1Y3_ZIZPA|nr:hypothetical protein GUJ93_ZPchr0006g42825 [Zizania palustris]
MAGFWDGSKLQGLESYPTRRTIGTSLLHRDKVNSLRKKEQDFTPAKEVYCVQPWPVAGLVDNYQITRRLHPWSVRPPQLAIKSSLLLLLLTCHENDTIGRVLGARQGTRNLQANIAHDCAVLYASSPLGKTDSRIVLSSQVHSLGLESVVAAVVHVSSEN